ncbi:MAG: hypothetical protein ABI665_02300 [Vicinamibacterales bacterium]
MAIHWKMALGAIVAIAISSGPTSATAGEAQGRDKGHGQQKGKGDKHPAQPAAIVVVIDQGGHRQAVGNYYSHASLPPGLAKKEALPPGLRKQLVEKGRLPPGLDKHFTPLPPELTLRLQPMPTYYHRYFAGRDLVVVDTRTNTFVAIIRDILQ